MDQIIDLIDRADAALAAVVTALGAWVVARQSRATNLRASIDSSAQDTIKRLEERVTALEKKMGVMDAYSSYAINEMRRVEDWLESRDLRWPPPRPMSFYEWMHQNHGEG